MIENQSRSVVFGGYRRKRTLVWSKLALLAVVPSLIALAGQAHAVPNDAVFLQELSDDGIVMDEGAAISEAQAVCKLMAPPNGGALWEAGQQVKADHPDWRMDRALKFADRAVQNYCPNRGSF